jgi:NTE family protein
MTKSALVLAGGGLAGIAWEIGVLLGIQDVEPDATARILDDSTTLLGTSAGAAVAAQLAGGTPLQDLFDAQLSDETSELFVDINLTEFGAMMANALGSASSPEAARRRMGEIALNADTVSPAERRAAIAGRLPVKTWGDRDLRVIAVDAESGEPHIFTRGSGVDLVDAVAASCAIPGIWPVVLIGGHKYMDGGMRTVANADLAAGASRVLVLVPSTEQTPMGRAIAQAELDALAPAPYSVVYADAASLAAFGLNPLDPGVRKPAALAGRERGRSVAAEVAAFWTA